MADWGEGGQFYQNNILRNYIECTMGDDDEMLAGR